MRTMAFKFQSDSINPREYDAGNESERALNSNLILLIRIAAIREMHRMWSLNSNLILLIPSVLNTY